MEYRDDRDLHVYTDGSSYAKPRRGGIGILFVSVGDDGHEQTHPWPQAGFEQATNNQMELTAAIEAMRGLATRRAPVDAAGFRRVVVWTDSMYLVDGFVSARSTWPLSDWMTASGNPVLNAHLWKDLMRWSHRVGRPVEVRWVKGHRTSKHNKTADKLAKGSARERTPRRVSVVKVRRKLSPESIDIGSVGMGGQRLTVRIVTDELLSTQELNRYTYEVMSRRSPFYRCVDVIYSRPDIYLSAGHTYFVKANSEQRSPRIEKVYREVGG